MLTTSSFAAREFGRGDSDHAQEAWCLLAFACMDMLDIDWEKVEQTAVWLREQEELGEAPSEDRERTPGSSGRKLRWSPSAAVVRLRSIGRAALAIAQHPS
jgi:hypothetical protein